MAFTPRYVSEVTNGNGSTGVPVVTIVDFGNSLMTPAFQRWFRDSRVTDKWGSPKLVFHSTPEKFTDFEFGDIGFHFGNKNQANNWLKK